MLATDRTGKVSEFKAKPGYGIQCVVSNLSSVLTGATRENVLNTARNDDSCAQIDGLAESSQAGKFYCRPEIQVKTIVHSIYCQAGMCLQFCPLI